MPMHECDHTDCPVELVGCPEHVAEQQRTMTEACVADSDFEAKCKRADEMPDGREKDALLQKIVESIFPGADDEGQR